MTTKTIWKADDIHAGMLVCKSNPREGEFEPCGWTVKWTHKIGFVPGDGTLANHRADRYCQIAMCDGMVYCRNKTKEAMAALLTEEDMIPMPYDWWIKTSDWMRKQLCPHEGS